MPSLGSMTCHLAAVSPPPPLATLSSAEKERIKEELEGGGVKRSGPSI